jgi:hypothetical protein
MHDQERANRIETTCPALSDDTGDEPPFLVPQSGKRINLVASISAYESFLTPLIVIPIKTIDADITLTGLIDEKVAVYS